MKRDRLGRRHDFYECVDNRRIVEPIFIRACKRIEVTSKSLIPVFLVTRDCAEGHGAWHGRGRNSRGENFGSDFVQAINKSGFGYSDGTGGHADIVSSMRPVAFGLALFDFLNIGGKSVQLVWRPLAERRLDVRQSRAQNCSEQSF